MKRFFILLVTLATVQAFAIGSLTLDMRTDMTSQTFNDEAKLAGAGVNNYRFNFQTARLDYKNNLNDSTSFRVRARLAGKNQGDITLRDGSNSTLDYAYAAHKISDMLKLTVGKLSSEVGGFEALIPGADNFYASEAFGGTKYFGVTAGSGSVNLAGFSNTQYVTGAKLTATFGTQDLSLIVANTDKSTVRLFPTNGDVTTGTPTAFSQNKSLLGLSYRGSLMEKMVTTFASFHTETIAEDVKAEFIGAGAQMNINPFMVQLEYLVNNSQSLSGTTILKDSLSTIQLRTAYNIDEQFTAGLRVSSSEEKIDAATAFKNKYMTVGASLEFKPVAEDVFRYHVAYNDRTLTPEAGDNRKLNEVIVGMRISADFLK